MCRAFAIRTHAFRLGSNRPTCSIRTACADGNGSFRINGLTRAQIEATAYAEAYAEGTVRASVCNRCSAAAEFVAESWSRIFFDAVAEAEINLQGAANGGSIRGATSNFVEAVAEATVVAYASVRSPRTSTPNTPHHTPGPTQLGRCMACHTEIDVSYALHRPKAAPSHACNIPVSHAPLPAMCSSTP